MLGENNFHSRVTHNDIVIPSKSTLNVLQIKVSVKTRAIVKFYIKYQIYMNNLKSDSFSFIVCFQPSSK